jgi:TolB protein
VPTTGAARIHVMASDGSGDAAVTDGADFSTFPAWSPDGRKLAFMAQHDSAWQVYTIGANGARLTALTTDAGANLFPTWKPATP